MTNAQYKCMANTLGVPATSKLISLTQTYSSSGKLDDYNNLKDDKVFLFSGGVDSVVDPDVMLALEEYYGSFVGSITSEFTINAEHCFPTLSYGNICGVKKSPYIGKCNYDGAGISLKTLLGTLTSGTAKAANLMQFDQTPYLPKKSASLDSTGYIYVPTECQNGAACHLHVAFHGCLQDQATIGNQYAADTGYNGWAEANNIIVLYPYAKKSSFSPSNPNG